MNGVVEATKTKIRLLNKDVESAWREDWNNIYDKIMPINKATIRPQLGQFESIVIKLIRIKAASMFKEVSQIVHESGIVLDQESLDEVKNFVLGYFVENDYLNRCDIFIEAVERKFSRYGLVFNKEEWRTDLVGSTFEVGVINTTRDIKASLNADFALCAASIQLPASAKIDSPMQSFFQCLELKPTFCGIGVNLNAFIEKLFSKTGLKKISSWVLFLSIFQMAPYSFAITDKDLCVELANEAIMTEIANKKLAKLPAFFPLVAPKPAPEVGAPLAVGEAKPLVEAPLSPIPACFRASEQGDPLAQMILGFCYLEGVGATKDKEKAEKLFNMAIARYKLDAEQGVAKAQFELGYLYSAGEVLNQDMVEAHKWFTTAISGMRISAEKGNENDQLKLGRIYAEGKLVQQDSVEAFKWYRKAAKNGVSAAQLELGKMYFWGQGIKQDQKEAEKWFSTAKDSKYGVCSEYIKIAKSYLFGENGLQQNESAANGWFNKAIDINKDRVGRVFFDIGEKYLSNNMESEAIKWFDWSVTLGSNQLFSKATEYNINKKNYAEAAKWYRIVALHGDVSSQRVLGWIYKVGDGVKQDFIESEKWYQLAANQDDADSQNELGNLYYEGLGVKKNFYTAFDWFKKAADQGNEYAQYSLGYMYRNGEGVPKNYSEAIKLFEKSANLGNTSAQASLGFAYYYGEGVPVNKVQSLAWATLAATENIEAANARDRIEKELPPNEVSQAQQLATQLKAKIDKRNSSLFDRLFGEGENNDPSFNQTTRVQLPVIDLPTVLSKPAFTSNDIAIIIGIEKYRTVPPTEYAAADAGMVRDYLKALGIPERNIEFLADDRATLSDIRKVIETKLPNMVKANSRVIVYYAGHGAPGTTKGESYLVPYDGDPSFLADTAYPLSRLYDRLSRLKAKEVLVILDSCFSGAGGRSVLAKNTRPLVMVKDTPPPTSKKMIVMTSSRGSQITTSLPETGHGAFTYFLLRALQEGNRDIGEVYAYLSPRVTEEAKRQNVDQTPTISPAADKLKGRFLFAR